MTFKNSKNFEAARDKPQGLHSPIIFQVSACFFALCLFFVITPLASAQTETELLRQEIQLQSQGPQDSKIADYFEKLKQTPLNAELHYQLAAAYQEKNLLELALHSYQRALQIDPKLAKAQVGLSQIFHKKNLKAQELRAMAEASQLNPQDPQIRFDLGLLYMQPENFDYKMAKKQYDELKKMNSPLALRLAEKMGIQP